MPDPVPSTLDVLTLFATLIHQQEEASTFQDLTVFEPDTKNVSYTLGVGGPSQRLSKRLGIVPASNLRVNNHGKSMPWASSETPVTELVC